MEWVTLHPFAFKCGQFLRLSNGGMNKVIRPNDTRPELFANSHLVVSTEFCTYPVSCAQFHFLNRTRNRRRAGAFFVPFHYKITRELCYITDRPEACLHFDVPACKRTVWLSANTQEIEFAHSVFNPANGKKTATVEPFFNEAFGEKRHASHSIFQAITPWTIAATFSLVALYDFATLPFYSVFPLSGQS